MFGRPLTMMEMVGLSLSGLAELRRRELPLPRPLTANDFTAGGRLAILRDRGYTDEEIEGLYPGLAAADRVE